MRLCLVWIALLLARVCVAQEIVRIQGTVVDRAGNPVKGALVGRHWQQSDPKERGPVRLKPYKGGVTDESGSFEFETEFHEESNFALMAVSADGLLGGISVSDSAKHTGHTLKLEPVTAVRVKLRYEDSQTVPEHVSAVVWVGDLRGPILFQSNSYSEEVELRLPASRYVIGLYGKDAQTVRREVNLEAPGSIVDLGDVSVGRAILPSLYGKVPPDLVFSESRGVPKSYRLSDSRGKWVILEFWGFW